MSATFTVGDLVDGKYRILRLIGEGGWGIVFEGENARTLKRVAIKVLRTQSSITPDIQARFEREAQAAGRIGSEHIVEVFDLGTLPDGTSYMVMELLSGEDLSTRVHNAGRLAPVVAVKLVMQLLEGLGAAHAAGILHRDLKPENLFLVPTRTGEDFVKILDFGISKFANAPAISATMTGAVLGSPFYMAPEQARGLKQIDVRTDLYAVGTVLFECLTGRVPFQGDNFNDLMFRIVLAPRPNPIEIVPDLDEELVPIVMKAISAEPADRYQTAEKFREALATWLDVKGVASARAPELRRAFSMTHTPRSDSGASDARVQLPSHSETRREKPSWSDATVAMPESVVGKDTPVASSSTLEPQRGGRRRVIAIAVGVAALVGVVAVVSAKRTPTRDMLTSDTPAASPPAPPAEPAPPPPATAEPLAAAVAVAPAATPSAAPSAAEPDETTGVQVSLHGHGSRGTHGQRTKDAGTVAAVPVAEAPKPAPAAPPAASPAKPADTVEGREIRTNL